MRGRPDSLDLRLSRKVSKLRYVKLWSEFLRLSWQRVPLLTASQFLAQALAIAASVGSALALRSVIDSSLRGEVGDAVVSALVAAVAGTTVVVCANIQGAGKIMAVEKVALTDLHAQIQRDVATLEGLEHLERTDFLDRMTVVCASPWSLMFGFWSAVTAVFTALELVAMLFLLGSVSPLLLSLILFAAAPLWFDQRGKSAVNKAETATAEAFRLQRHLFELGTDASSGKDLRIAGAAAELARRQRDAWDEAVWGRFRARITAAMWKLSGWVLFTIGFGSALGLVAYRAAHRHGGVGDIVLAITVAVSLRQSLQAAVTNSTAAAGAGRQIEPYLWLRDYVSVTRSRAMGREQTPARLADGITFDQVDYTYPGTDRPALDSISVHLPAASVVAIVGEYGSGKSTLVKLLSKFYEPSGGAIRVDGIDLAELETKNWRTRSSAAYQDFGRFETVFAESVGLGDLPYIDDRERIGEAIAEANAEALVVRLPQGVDTQLGSELGGVDLSEGQWQKTALARAAMRRNPLLFILDEPTASLDAPSEREIFQRHMRRARRLGERTGAITVIVSHRFSTVTDADLILVLDKGKLIEAGTHDELIGIADGRYADLYGLQAAAYAAG